MLIFLISYHFVRNWTWEAVVQGVDDLQAREGEAVTRAALQKALGKQNTKINNLIGLQSAGPR